MDRLSLIFGPTRTAISEIRVAAKKHRGGRVRVVVAWARDGGVCWLLDALDGNISNVEVMVGVNEKGTTVEALLRLLPYVKSLTVFYKHRRQTFHPKIYWFDDGSERSMAITLIVGSSNLTHGGLRTNFEASLVAEISGKGSPSDVDSGFFASIKATWDEIAASSHLFPIKNPGQIKELYEAGYIVTEETVRRSVRLSARSVEVGRDLLPVSPPPRIPPPSLGEIKIPFPLRREPPAEKPQKAAAPVPTKELAEPHQFFVRTLTKNDVSKFHAKTPGTFEPDLGLTARDEEPVFWGWNDEYKLVSHRLGEPPRSEWVTKAMLISTLAPSEGIPIKITLWFREERLDSKNRKKAAEFRITPHPIGNVRKVVPEDFDDESLFVVERAAPEAGYTFTVRLITQSEPDFKDYASYLVKTRPEHRYGYGP